MITESNTKQDRIVLEPLDAIMVRVVLNANETKTDVGYTYDRYVQDVINRPMLLQIIENDFDAWVNNLAQREEPKPKTMEERIMDLESVVKGTPSYSELLEAVNILLGE